MPSWMYHGRLADVYYYGGHSELMLASLDRALTLAPENPTVLLDVALGLTRFQQDLPRARLLLERAKTHALSDMMVPFAKAAEGMIALEEGDPRKAKPELVDALKSILAFRNATPLVGSWVDRIHTYLALTDAALGDTTGAERHFRIAEPRLRALRSDDLLERCQAAIGGR